MKGDICGVCHDDLIPPEFFSEDDGPTQGVGGVEPVDEAERAAAYARVQYCKWGCGKGIHREVKSSSMSRARARERPPSLPTHSIAPLNHRCRLLRPIHYQCMRQWIAHSRSECSIPFWPFSGIWDPKIGMCHSKNLALPVIQN